MKKTPVQTFVQLGTTLLAVMVWFSSPARCEVVPIDRDEAIQRSSLIFVGKVLEKSCRWNERGNLIVTDYVIQVDKILFGQHAADTITLTFAGGEFDGEGHSITGVPEFDVGQVGLLMVEESTTPLFSPITGMFQGKYTAIQLPDYIEPVVFDGQDRMLTKVDGQPIHFDEFIQTVSRQIPIAKSRPLPDRSVRPEFQKYVINDLPSLEYNSKTIANHARIEQPAIRPGVAKPSRLEDFRYESSEQGQDIAIYGGGIEPQEWSYVATAPAPVVFNPWPDTFGTWLRNHDQYAMAYWNDYADIFRVMTPTGDWAWGNDRFDMAGFPSNQVMIDQFGSGWGSSTLAICYRRWNASNPTVILESDVACNPAFSWTTNDYETYSDPNLYNLDRTLTHELGHAWGLDHQFNALSVMNYSPKKYRAYNVIYLDDCLAIRNAYPNESVSLADLGVSLFYHDPNNSQDYDDSIVNNPYVASGDSIQLSEFTIENCGTSTMSPEIDWYLCPSINSWTDAVFVGTTTHSSLSPGFYFITSRTLTIPEIDDGTYYFGAVVRNSEDALSDNDVSWLDVGIVVDNPPPPPNDDWEDRHTVASFPASVSGTNFHATEQANEPDLNPAAATVWWEFTAPNSGTITSDTFGSDFDTILDAYLDAGAITSIDQLASNDNADGGLQSAIEFSVEANQVYLIRVSGKNGVEGNINLNIEFEPDPAQPNDNWADSIDIGTLPIMVIGSNVGATVEPDEQNLGPAGSTIWWHVQAPGDGVITVNTLSSNFDTMLHIYSGRQNGFSNLSLIAQNDNIFTGTTVSEVTFPVVAGEIYEIRIAGKNNAQGDAIFVTEFANNEVIPPFGINVSGGILRDGSALELATNDGSDLSIMRDSNSINAITEFRASFFSPFREPTRLDITLDGSVFARNEIIQTIEVFNWETFVYETISMEPAARSPSPDQTVTATATGDLSRFVGSNRGVRVRIRYSAVVSRMNFSSNTDQLYLSIE